MFPMWEAPVQEKLGHFKSVPRVATTRVDHSHTSSVHGVHKAVDEDHWDLGPCPTERHTQICLSCQPWAYVNESSLDLDKCSMGFKSGLRASRDIFLMMCCWRKSLVALAVWDGRCPAGICGSDDGRNMSRCEVSGFGQCSG